MKYLISFMVMTFGLIVWAQSPSPSVAPVVMVPPPSLGDVLLSMIGLIKSWQNLGLFAGLAAALKLLVDGSKALGIFDKIPQVFQALFVMLVGVLTVGLGILSAGGSMAQAVTAALGSSAAAMMFHEVLDDLLGLIKSNKEVK